MNFYMIITFVTIQVSLIMTLNGDTVQELHASLSNSIPVTINRVVLPYISEFVQDASQYQLVLDLFNQEANEIIDEEEWFDQYHLPFPLPDIQTKPKEIPEVSKYGDLKFSKQHGDCIYALYEHETTLKEPLDIYISGYEYALAVFTKEGQRYTLQTVYDLARLFWDVLKVCSFDVVDSLVYFNTAFNGYAEIVDEKTGYLYCFDTNKGHILWATKNLISSYRGFTLYKDYVITGYGFTAEPDFLYVVNRYTGKIIQIIPIKTAHEYIIIKDDFVYVRSYNTNYVFSIQQIKK